MTFRQGTIDDVEQLRLLGLASWAQFKDKLTQENWTKLYNNLNKKETYIDLLKQSSCIVCQDHLNRIVGMAFLVPSGNPTDIYQEDWSYIRFVPVHPEFSGRGIGRLLTLKCIEMAKANNEHIVALHTSEMMEKARHIYESLGFKILHELQPRLGKRYWLYTLRINNE